MKLHHGRIASAKGSANRIEDHVRESVQGSLVHLVQQPHHRNRDAGVRGWHLDEVYLKIDASAAWLLKMRAHAKKYGDPGPTIIRVAGGFPEAFR
jgi:hypothetical protein